MNIVVVLHRFSVQIKQHVFYGTFYDIKGNKSSIANQLVFDQSTSQDHEDQQQEVPDGIKDVDHTSQSTMNY